MKTNIINTLCGGLISDGCVNDCPSLPRSPYLSPLLHSLCITVLAFVSHTSPHPSVSPLFPSLFPSPPSSLRCPMSYFKFFLIIAEARVSRRHRREWALRAPQNRVQAVRCGAHGGKWFPGRGARRYGNDFVAADVGGTFKATDIGGGTGEGV